MAKTELKEITTIRMYPSHKKKAKRLGINISKMIAEAIAALPEPKEEGEES